MTVSWKDSDGWIEIVRGCIGAEADAGQVSVLGQYGGVAVKVVSNESGNEPYSQALVSKVPGLSLSFLLLFLLQNLRVRLLQPSHEVSLSVRRLINFRSLVTWMRAGGGNGMWTKVLELVTAE